jgi:hypothetical protein
MNEIQNRHSTGVVDGGKFYSNRNNGNQHVGSRTPITRFVEGEGDACPVAWNNNLEKVKKNGVDQGWGTVIPGFPSLP